MLRLLSEEKRDIFENTNMDKIKKYCYRKVDFPKTAYAGFLFMKNKDGGEKRMLCPLTFIFEKQSFIEKRIKKLKLELNNYDKCQGEVYGALVMKIKFNRTSPLKKEFWTTNNDLSLDDGHKINEYVKILKNKWYFYKIMIVPVGYNVKNDKWFFVNWLPVKPTTTDDELAKIAIMSDIEVYEPAKDMALYTIEWVKGFDTNIGEIVEKDNDSKLNC